MIEDWGSGVAMLNALNVGCVGPYGLFWHAHGGSPAAALSEIAMAANVKSTRLASCLRFMIRVSKL